MAAPPLGADCTLNRNTGTYGTPVWTPWAFAQDVTLDQSFTEADVTSRGAGKVQQQEPVLVVLGITFTALAIEADTAFVALRTAYYAKTVLDMAVCNGSMATTGTFYVRTDFKIFSFQKKEPVNGVQTYEVTMKPCYSTNGAVTGTNS